MNQVGNFLRAKTRDPEAQPHLKLVIDDHRTNHHAQPHHVRHVTPPLCAGPRQTQHLPPSSRNPFLQRLNRALYDLRSTKSREHRLTHCRRQRRVQEGPTCQPKARPRQQAHEAIRGSVEPRRAQLVAQWVRDVKTDDQQRLRTSTTFCLLVLRQVPCQPILSSRLVLSVWKSSERCRVLISLT